MPISLANSFCVIGAPGVGATHASPFRVGWYCTNANRCPEHMEKYFRIGDLARICGVSPRTVDYYTRLGLISPCNRSSGMHRLYDESAIEQMHLIKGLQARRLSLAEIAGQLRHRDTASSVVLPRLREIEEDLARLDREVVDLRPELMALAPSGETRQAVVRTVSAAMAYALAVANHLSRMLAEGGPGFGGG